MTREDIQIWIDDLATVTEDTFKELITGIAEHFYQFGTLSTKQRKALHVTASKLGKQTPRELSDYASNEPKEMLSELIKATGIGGQVRAGNPLADMLKEIAMVLNRTAEKLK